MSEKEEATESVGLDSETAEILRRLATKSGKPLSKLTQDLCEMYAKQSGLDLRWEQGEPKEAEREELWTKWASMPDDERRKAFQLMTLGRSGLNALHVLWETWNRQTLGAQDALVGVMDSPNSGKFAVAMVRLLRLDDSQLKAVEGLLREPDTIHDILTPIDDMPSPNREEGKSESCGSCHNFFLRERGDLGTECRNLPPVMPAHNTGLAEYPRVSADTPQCSEYSPKE